LGRSNFLQRKKVEIPSLVHDSPSWLIPLTEIIGFKSTKHKTPIPLPIPEKYVSDYTSSDSDSDVEFGRRRSSVTADTSGYSYYDSPDATPRPTFSTPAIPINAPPRTRRKQDISRNASQESIVQSTTSSHREHRFPHQPHASPEIAEFQVLSFVTHGRITNYAKILFFLPRYLRCSTTCYEKLVGSARGGLARGVKMYVCLLAAAEVGSQYFVSYFSAKFGEVGGDLAWIRGGVTEVPPRIQRITALNAKMVAEPWALSVEDVTALMQPGEDEEEEGWTVAEAVQIITILAMFQTQSNLALATGVVCEADVFGGTVWRRIRDDDNDSDLLFSGTKKRTFHFSGPDAREEISDKLRLKMVTDGHMSPDMSFDNLEVLRRTANSNGHARNPRNEGLFTELLNEERTVQMTTTARSPTRSGSSTATDPVNPVIDDLSRFTASPTPSAAGIFPASMTPSKMNWEDALHTLQAHLPDLATNLDKRFHLPPTRTFLQTPSRDRLDAKPFKQALQAYSLALLGWYGETYDYTAVSDFLGDELREFIRRIVLGARGLSKEDWENIRGAGFCAVEVVEICMMVLEARFMGILLYAYKVIAELG
jgi:PA26 p53-induced protein (sestrin)